MGQFEEDTAVTPLGDNRWQGELKRGWRIGSVPNGGYVLAVIGRALRNTMPHKDPLSINAFYLAPCSLGVCTIEVELLKAGRGTSFGTASLYQNDELRVRATAAYTDLDLLAGETWMGGEPPSAPTFESMADDSRAQHLEIHQRVDSRLVTGYEVFESGELPRSGEFVGYLQHVDKAAMGSIDLLMFADIMPPPSFTLFGPFGWVPTIELTVQCRGLPVPGPLLGRMTSRYLTSGIIESDGDFWDSKGQLVALARQTMKVRLPKKNAHQ